jgi:hypothetical protein
VGFPWHADRVQWHWGNIGSAAAGLSVAASVAYALLTGKGPAWLREAREQAKQQAALAAEERKQIELDRERVLYGWAGAGSSGEVYKVALVTDPAEMETARRELAAPKNPGQYVILRINEHPDPLGNAGRAYNLRQLIETSGLLSRAPEPGEYEVLRNAARDLHKAAGPNR